MTPAQLHQHLAQTPLAKHLHKIHITTADQIQDSSLNPKAQAWYNPTTDRITLIADRIKPHTATFVAWHEMGHRNIAVSGWLSWQKAWAKARQENPLVNSIAQKIQAQRQDDQHPISHTIATEEATAELYAAHKTRQYDQIQTRYQVVIPTAQRRTLGGFFARLQQKLTRIAHCALGKDAPNFQDGQIYGLLKGMERAEKTAFRQPAPLWQPETALDLRYSRTTDTQAKYEARIDALFSGDKAKLGTVVLDRSDVMDMLGYGRMPLVLAESHVRDNFRNNVHPEMTAEQWKKVPEWLENPIIAYENLDDYNPNRIVLVAPEYINGHPVLMAIEPKPIAAQRGKTNDFQLLVTVFAKDSGLKLNRILREEKLRYVDTEKAADLFRRAGNQSPRQAVTNQRQVKILTEKNLRGYRKSIGAAENAQSENKFSLNLSPNSFTTTAEKLGGEAAYQAAKDAGKTELTYQQWVQVRTPKFKAWFGDWENDPENASKVINPRTGEPLMVYHGTTADFTVFDPKKDAVDSNYGRGFFITENKQMAQHYANGWDENDNPIKKEPMATFVNVRNPFILNRDQVLRNHLNKLSGSRYANGIDHVHGINPYLQANGYDGVKVTDNHNGFNELVVHSPTQIKSATANIGAFSPENPDIRYSFSQPERSNTMYTTDYSEAQRALYYLDPNDRDTWWKMGAALKSEFDEGGKQMWEEWSRQYPHWKQNESNAQWKSFKHGHINIGTLFHLAQQNGFEHSKTYHAPSTDEIAQREAVWAIRREVQTARDTVSQNYAAAQAQRKFRYGKPTDGTHAYLQNKGIAQVAQQLGIAINRYTDKNGIAHNDILVPIYADGKLINLQSIAEDGSKKFEPYARVNSGSTLLGNPKDIANGAYLVEGLATGLSVYAATDKPIIVAFNAGNLPHVAQAIREKYPNAPIAIAADNDLISQTGIKKATEAAQILGGNSQIVMPEFSADDIAQFQAKHGQDSLPSDFNDLHELRGLKAVQAALNQPLPKDKLPEIPARSNDTENEAAAHERDAQAIAKLDPAEAQQVWDAELAKIRNDKIRTAVKQELAARSIAFRQPESQKQPETTQPENPIQPQSRQDTIPSTPQHYKKETTMSQLTEAQIQKYAQDIADIDNETMRQATIDEFNEMYGLSIRNRVESIIAEQQAQRVQESEAQPETNDDDWDKPANYRPHAPIDFTQTPPNTLARMELHTQVLHAFESEQLSGNYEKLHGNIQAAIASGDVAQFAQNYDAYTRLNDSLEMLGDDETIRQQIGMKPDAFGTWNALIDEYRDVRKSEAAIHKIDDLVAQAIQDNPAFAEAAAPIRAHSRAVLDAWTKGEPLPPETLENPTTAEQDFRQPENTQQPENTPEKHYSEQIIDQLAEHYGWHKTSERSAMQTSKGISEGGMFNPEGNIVMSANFNETGRYLALGHGWEDAFDLDALGIAPEVVAQIFDEYAKQYAQDREKPNLEEIENVLRERNHAFYEQKEAQQEQPIMQPENTTLVFANHADAVEYEAINTLRMARTIAQMQKIEPQPNSFDDVAKYLNDGLTEYNQRFADTNLAADERARILLNREIDAKALSLEQQGISDAALQQRAEQLLNEATRLPEKQVEQNLWQPENPTPTAADNAAVAVSETAEAAQTTVERETEQEQENTISFDGREQDLAQNPPIENENPERETITTEEALANLRKSRIAEEYRQRDLNRQPESEHSELLQSKNPTTVPEQDTARQPEIQPTQNQSTSPEQELGSLFDYDDYSALKTQPHENIPKSSQTEAQSAPSRPKPVLDLNYQTAAGLEARYVRVQGKYMDLNDRKTVAFRDKGDTLKTSKSDPQIISDMLDTAQAKNWNMIKISGSHEFKQQMWLEASLRGIPSKGYTPSEYDTAKLNQLLDERQRNSIQEGKTADRQPEKQPESTQTNFRQPETVQPAQATEQPTQPEITQPAQPQDKSAQKPRFNPNEPAILLEHGKDHYQHNPQEGKSYYFKVEQNGEVYERWAKELENEAERLNLQKGDTILIPNPEQKPVEVPVQQRDEHGKPLTDEQGKPVYATETKNKNFYDIQVIERAQKPTDPSPSTTAMLSEADKLQTQADMPDEQRQAAQFRNETVQNTQVMQSASAPQQAAHINPDLDSARAVFEEKYGKLGNDAKARLAWHWKQTHEPLLKHLKATGQDKWHNDALKNYYEHTAKLMHGKSVKLAAVFTNASPEQVKQFEQTMLKQKQHGQNQTQNTQEAAPKKGRKM